MWSGVREQVEVGIDIITHDQRGSSYSLVAVLRVLFVLPFVLLAISGVKALWLLVTGRSRIGWIGGFAAVLSGLYLIPIVLFSLLLPAEAYRLAPLGVGLLVSSLFLFVCGLSDAESREKAHPEGP